MYAGVPITTPSAVAAGLHVSRRDRRCPERLCAFAMPKSRTFTRPSAVDHDVRELQVAMDDALLVRDRQRLGQRRGDLEEAVRAGSPLRHDARSSDCPSTSCIVRKCTLPGAVGASSTEYTVTMPGWSRAARALASRWNRARRSGSRATSDGSTFSATSRPSLVSVAAIDLAHAAFAKLLGDAIVAVTWPACTAEFYCRANAPASSP